ncbi:MAG TPA: hypothetical protein V6D15_18750 [Oculatellaceae cyanobacterium]
MSVREATPQEKGFSDSVGVGGSLPSGIAAPEGRLSIALCIRINLGLKPTGTKHVM